MATHSRMVQTRRRRKKDLKKSAREAKSQDKAARPAPKKRAAEPTGGTPSP